VRSFTTAHPFEWTPRGPCAKDRALPRFKSLKSATIGKRTAVRMLSFTEAHEPKLYLLLIIHLLLITYLLLLTLNKPVSNSQNTCLSLKLRILSSQCLGRKSVHWDIHRL